MIDGKISSILSDTGSQNCNVCLAKPSMFNKIDQLLLRPTDKSALQLFVSVLHAWIRFLELCLHVAYRLTIKHSYSKYTDKQKADMETQKTLVKRNLKEGLGIKVDSPKPRSCGNTNDGNLARKFFEDPAITATLTGENLSPLNITLIKITLSFKCIYIFS